MITVRKVIMGKLQDCGFMTGNGDNGFLLSYPGIERTLAVSDEDYDRCFTKNEAVAEIISLYMKGLQEN